MAFEFTFKNPSLPEAIVESSIVSNGLIMYLDSANPKSNFNGLMIFPDVNYYGVSNSGSWLDLSNHNNSASIYTFNQPMITSSFNNNIINFGAGGLGVGWTYAECTNIGNYVITGSFTVSLWMYYNVLNTQAQAGYCLVTRGNASYYLSVFESQQPMINSHLYNPLGLISENASASYNFNINTWYNVCATYTPTSYTYYVNGNSLGTVLYSSLPDYAPITMGNPYLISGSTAVSAALNAINIGCDMQDTVDTPFFGYINNVGIYNRTLSPSEVLQDYNAIRHMYGQ